MPTNKPFFPNLREVKKVITPKGEVSVRKTCKPVEALVMVEVEGTQKGARFVGIFARNGQAIRCPPLDSPTATDLAVDFSGLIEREGFQLSAISAEHAIRAGLLPGPSQGPI